MNRRDMIKASRRVKQTSWSKLLRFPIIFGSFLLFAGYSVLNFEDIFKGKLKSEHNRLWGASLDRRYEQTRDETERK